IPQLSKADASKVGIAVVGVKGRVFSAGDADAEFTIQSISKPFVYALALEELGIDAVLESVGVEPSGEPFNAISLDEASGRPMNPRSNSGAIVVASRLSRGATEKGFERFAGRELTVDKAGLTSELETGHRNRALADLALASGVLRTSVEDA